MHKKLNRAEGGNALARTHGPNPDIRRNPLQCHLSPRCGARARRTGAPCRSPAMPNGRCQMHGGKAGAPTIHGMRSQRRKLTRDYLRTLFALVYVDLGVPNQGDRSVHRMYAPRGGLSVDELRARAQRLRERRARLQSSDRGYRARARTDKPLDPMREIALLIKTEQLDMGTKVLPLQLLMEFQYEKPKRIPVEAAGNPIVPPEPLTLAERAVRVQELLEVALKRQAMSSDKLS